MVDGIFESKRDEHSHDPEGKPYSRSYNMHNKEFTKNPNNRNLSFLSHKSHSLFPSTKYKHHNDGAAFQPQKKLVEANVNDKPRLRMIVGMERDGLLEITLFFSTLAGIRTRHCSVNFTLFQHDFSNSHIVGTSKGVLKLRRVGAAHDSFLAFSVKAKDVKRVKDLGNGSATSLLVILVLLRVDHHAKGYIAVLRSVNEFYNSHG